MAGIAAKIRENLNSPRRMVALAMAVAGCFVLFYVFFNNNVPHDVANCYGYMAREFARGNWSRAYYPGLPPLQTTLGGILCVAGVPPFPAMQLVSGLFFVLTVLPLYEFLKRFFSRREAAWGTLMYVLAPPLIRYGCTGMPGSARNFFVMLALVLLFSFLDAPQKRRKLIGIGFAFAGMSMSRGEGLALAAFLGFALMILLWRKSEFSLEGGVLKKNLLSIVLLIISTAFFMMPRLVQNYLLVGYAVPDYRVAMAINAGFEEWTRYIGTEVEPAVPERPAAVQAASADGGEVLFATEPAVEEEISGSLSRVIADSVAGGYWVYLMLGVIGVVYLLNKRRWRVEYNLLLLLIGFNSALFYFVVSSSRYYTVNVPLLMVFSLSGLLLIKNVLEKRHYGWFFPVLVLLCAVHQAGSALKFPLDRTLAYQKKAGLWIKENARLFSKDASRLKMYQSTQSQICFWSDSDPVHKAMGPMLNPRTFDKFDIAIFSPRNQRWLDVLAEREDVEEVMENPFRRHVLMFRKKSSEKRIETDNEKQ